MAWNPSNSTQLVAACDHHLSPTLHRWDLRSPNMPFELLGHDQVGRNSNLKVQYRAARKLWPCALHRALRKSAVPISCDGVGCASYSACMVARFFAARLLI